MNKILCVFAGYLWVCICAASANALHAESCLAEKAIESSAASDTLQRRSVYSSDVDFNVLESRFQKRYIPKGKPFYRKHFWERFNLGATLGALQLAPLGEKKADLAASYGVFAGYDFTRLHGVRFSAYYQEWKLEDDYYPFRQAGVDVDYLFDLTSYISGHNPRRFFMLKPFVGVGAIVSRHRAINKLVLKGQVGAQFAFRLNRNAQIYLEPVLSVCQDKIDMQNNPSRYDLLYGARAGLLLNLNLSDSTFQSPRFNGNLFFDLSQGAAVRLTRNDLDLFAKMGTSFEVGVGKWFTPLLGGRLSASMADYYWRSASSSPRYVAGVEARPSYKSYYKGVYAGGRFEFLLNPLMFSSFYREHDHMFDVNISLGYEIGMLSRTYDPRLNHTMRKYYNGPTGTVQLLYNVNSTSALFLQGRGLLAFYSFPYKNSGRKESYTDKMTSLSLGVRVQRPTRQMLADRSDAFEPYFFVSGHVGGVKHGVIYTKRQGDKFFNFLGNVSGGYHHNPYVGARFGVEYFMISQNKISPYEIDAYGRTFKYSAQWRHTYGLLNMKLNYMLNLSNVYQKYDSERKLNLFLNAGLMYGLYVSQSAKVYSKETLLGGTGEPRVITKDLKGSGSWGAFGGLQANLRLTNHWSVYVEPELQHYFKDKFFLNAPARFCRDLVIKFNLGTTYNF